MTPFYIVAAIALTALVGLLAADFIAGRHPNSIRKQHPRGWGE